VARTKASRCSCGKPGIFYRHYEGNHYCKFCFPKSIERRAKKHIGKNRMIKSGDRIAVALSGGKDSAAVLYFMNSLLKHRRDVKLFAITIDEGIKGYRPQTIRTAKKLCKDLGVKHYVYSFRKELGKTMDSKLKDVKGPLQEPCTYCGVGRRYILNKAARKLKATKLCTGHCLDDEVQSILMNYLRGDLLRASRMGAVANAALSKEKRKFIPRIKPFRIIPQKEVALYALTKGLPFHEEECPHRGGIRFEVGDFFNSIEEKHAGMKIGFLESFDKILPHLKKAGEYGEPRIYHCKHCKEPGSKKVCMTCQLWK
jgi:uncharacterized protein (TIGR00269 family)